MFDAEILNEMFFSVWSLQWKAWLETKSQMQLTLKYRKEPSMS